MLKVRCIQNGYIGHKRKYDGDIFYIEKKEFSEVWMEKLDDDNKEPVTMHSRVNKSYSMARLFDYCKTHKLTNYSGLEHEELVDAINNGELDPETEKTIETPVKTEVVESGDVI